MENIQSMHNGALLLVISMCRNPYITDPSQVLTFSYEICWRTVKKLSQVSVHLKAK